MHEHHHGHGHGHHFEQSQLHSHHETYEETEKAFPANEETLFLALADQVASSKLSARHDMSIGELEKYETEYGLLDIQARLGEKAPSLGIAEYATVAAAFAEQYNSLPLTHPRYEHSHNHETDHHDCGKIHGPLRRRLDALEEKALGKITNKRANALAAAAFRLSALTFCPGDDIAAIGAQVYGAVSGKVEGHGKHHEEQAILPRRPRIDFQLEEGKARVILPLPLDVPLAHDGLPHTKAAAVVREATEDVGPAQREAFAARIEKEAAQRPEKRRRRRRIMAMGALALSALGIGFNSPAATQPQQSAVVAPPPQPSLSQVDTRLERELKPLRLDYLQSVTAKKGDSQWSITQRQVEASIDTSSTALVSAATAYTVYANHETYTNPHQIEVGDKLSVASPHTIETFHEALTDPRGSHPKLAQYLERLNAQASYYSEDSRTVLQRIDAYLRS